MTSTTIYIERSLEKWTEFLETYIHETFTTKNTIKNHQTRRNENKIRELQACPCSRWKTQRQHQLHTNTT